MSENSTGASEPGSVVSQLVVEYVKRKAAGKSVSVEQFIAAHPEYSDELSKLLNNKDYLKAVKEADAQASSQTFISSTDVGELTSDNATDITIISDNADTETSVTLQYQLNSSANSELSFPEMFGRYEIKKVLGQGAMGSVYLAVDTHLHREVALKVPKFGNMAGIDETEMLERFYREARAAATLRSPNICPVYDVGEIDGQHYISMAFIKGRPLKDFTKSNKRHPQAKVAVTVRKLALALSEAHEIGVVHRDLKPANIMVDKRGEPVVMDFGLAQISTSDEVQLTQTGAIMGTPAYMSPEQIDGEQDRIGPQTDIFSLGVILYELLTGKMPFTGNLTSLLKQIAVNNPKPIPDLRDNVDPRLVNICQKMMATELVDRYATMEEVASDLLDVIKNPAPKLPQDNPNKKITKPLEPAATAPVPGASESNPSLISVADVPSYPEKQRKKNSPPRTKSPDDAPKNRLPLFGAGGIGAIMLLLGLIFFVRVGKYDVQITLNDPNIKLSVDAGRALKIEDGQDIYKLSAGVHQLHLEKDGFKTDLKEFTVKKDAENSFFVRLVNNKAVISRAGEVPLIAKPKTPPLVSETNNELNFALSFDGKSSYVALPDLKYDLRKPMTFEAIVVAKKSQLTVAEQTTILGHLGFRLVLAATQEVGHSLGFMRPEGDDLNRVFSKVPVPVNQKTHIAGVWDGKELNLYIDGEKQGTGHPIKDPSNLASLFSIGASIDFKVGPLSFFEGIIDDVRISNIARYNEDFTPEKNLQSDLTTIAIYKFDEGSGDVLKDSSGNGHDGKIVGAKWVEGERTLNPPQTDTLISPKVALEFDGMGQVVVRDIPWGELEEFTFEAFVRADASDEPVRARMPLNRFGTATLLRWGDRWVFSVTNENSKIYPESRTVEPMPMGRWDHIAGVQANNLIQLFVNGEPMDATRLPKDFIAGRGNALVLGSHFIGAIAGIKISKSAKYTTGFVPPHRFSKENDTLALYHFDEGIGDLLTDSSGNGHDGQIIEAKWVPVGGLGSELLNASEIDLLRDH